MSSRLLLCNLLLRCESPTLWGRAEATSRTEVLCIYSVQNYTYE